MGNAFARKAEVASGAGRASPVELLQFNLSKPVASVIIGCEQLVPLEQNVQAALNFTPISEGGKQQKLQEKVAPKLPRVQLALASSLVSYGVMYLRTHEDSVASS